MLLPRRPSWVRLSRSPLAGAAAPRLELDFPVEIVVRVLRFPVAERQAQAVQQRAIDVAPLFGWRFDLVLRHESEVLRAAPALEQVLERLADDAFALAAADLAQARKIAQVVLDQDTTRPLAAPATARF